MFESERQGQLDYHEQESEQLDRALSEGHAVLDDWSYSPPASDDWEGWRGVLKWCALDQRYRFHIEMAIFLRHGEGPFFCSVCEEQPEGHFPITCLECAWDTVLYDGALQDARDLGRAWSQAQEVAA